MRKHFLWIEIKLWYPFFCLIGDKKQTLKEEAISWSKNKVGIDLSKLDKEYLGFVQKYWCASCPLVWWLPTRIQMVALWGHCNWVWKIRHKSEQFVIIFSLYTATGQTPSTPPLYLGVACTRRQGFWEEKVHYLIKRIIIPLNSVLPLKGEPAFLWWYLMQVIHSV